TGSTSTSRWDRCDLLHSPGRDAARPPTSTRPQAHGTSPSRPTWFAAGATPTSASMPGWQQAANYRPEWAWRSPPKWTGKHTAANCLLARGIFFGVGAALWGLFLTARASHRTTQELWLLVGLLGLEALPATRGRLLLRWRRISCRLRDRRGLLRATV